MNRRDLLALFGAGVSALVLPWEPKRVYSFVRRGEPMIRIYEGAAPITKDAALTKQVLLSDLRVSGTSFADYSADRTGTASFARMTDELGRAVWQAPIVTSQDAGPGLRLDSRAIVAGYSIVLLGAAL